jgi:hypothetical protein
MRDESHQEVTQLLLAWGNGDDEALSRLTPLIYGELHRLAQSYMRRRGTKVKRSKPRLL